MTPVELALLDVLVHCGDDGASIVPGSLEGITAATLVDLGYACCGGQTYDSEGRFAYRVRVTVAGEVEALKLASRSAAAA